MKYSIHKIILWMNDNSGYRRELQFEENKVNVITGESNTGKTAILHIVDYCLFASKHKIAESQINENVVWYGLNFKINDKYFTIARKAPNRTNVSSDYYFSSTGEIPEFPSPNMTEGSLKEILETEFNIDKDVTIPFGGRSLKANSKISLRYFMLFCTISGDIIQHSEVFFDKQNDSRYREALPRIFDLAVGIETIENILKREKVLSLQAELAKIEKKNKQISEKKSEFHDELKSIAMEAKEYGLIDEGDDIPDSIESLKSVIDDGISQAYDTKGNRFDEIISEKNLLERKVRNLMRFQSAYNEYKSSLNVIEDSLKPVEYWRNKDEIVKTSIFDTLITSLEEDLQRIKQLNRKRTPIDGKTSDEIAACRRLINELEEEARGLPKQAKSFGDDRDKYIFLGQTKTKIDIYQPKNDYDEIKSTKEIEEQINSIQVLDITESRELCIKVVEEIIQGYMKLVETSLENYGNYLPVFNYKDKKIDFRKPKTTYIEAAGSSSNDMFKHLFMFLGLHELMLTKNNKHVPSFLLIDQPSRPYYGEEENVSETRLHHSDRAKIIDAFKLMDTFIGNVLNDMKQSFQMIVFEHVPKDYFNDFDNIHLVEEFRDGNALVPQEYLDSLK
ncbi:DUF3732 domain-containing protein [Methylicorpusculum oleiharenae]|uniref:DUF3732 domain-containing protein n=1 Tax=Methylicorpusculum oleiharenae TaxID=1338687 RepID=UPI0013597EF9|nr:DUF3732 domain-containing protein [Methylicorpusculum oleiharenae]MCD2452409.1 DUF3732 domain-containing protein [Methylicorpusculum oleiharenae]